MYERIYAVIKQIPLGKVATYGQIAKIVGGCTPRMVGYALAALKEGSNVPWQRVINSRGEVSLRSDGMEYPLQQRILEAEGVLFDEKGKVDFEIYGWKGID